MSRTTGYQAKVGAKRQVMAAPADGKIVAWTITLGSPGKSQINYFNDNFGGAATAGISVLKPGKKLRHKVNGHSPLQRLQPYFGTTVQFPLDRTLTVRKGYLVALTVPSWAPALALGHGQRHAVAGEPPDQRLRRAGQAVGAARPREPGPVPLPVPDGAPDLQRDDDHDAEAAEAEVGPRGDASRCRRRRRG